MRFLDRLRKAAHKSVIEAKRAVLAQLRPSKEQNLRHLRERGESIESFRFRDATQADIPALAQLHVTAWNATYPACFNPPAVELREWQWRKAFTEENGGSWFCIVIERPDGALVGFAKGKRADDHPTYQGELNKIYLLPEYYRSAAFHEAVGGRNIVGKDGKPEYGNYYWDDLERLAEICPV